MGTFKSNLQKEVNFLPEWEDKKPLNDKYSYQLNGQPLFSENQNLKTRPNGISLDNWAGDLIHNHVESPNIVNFKKVDKWTLNLEDTWISSRDSFVINNDRSQDYYRHRLNINNYTKKVLTDGNYTYIGDNGENPNFSTYPGTSYENEDPVIYGFDILLDGISSPLLNGSVEDFINQYSYIHEVANRMGVIADFKKQLVKIFHTKGKPFLGKEIGNQQSSEYDEYAWATGGQSRETSFSYGKVSYLSHYIQKITGLDQLVERNTTEAHKPFSEWPKNKLTISFYEDVSGTMGALAHLYKLLYWSIPNGKSIIPENLLRFNCSIVISEIRNYKRVIKAKNDNNLKIVKDNVSRYIYSLKECQFFFNKMSHDGDIDLSNTKVYGDGGPGLDVEMNWKFASTKFEKWISDDRKSGKYVGYDTGAMWRKNPKSSPQFNYITNKNPDGQDINEVVFDDYNNQNYHDSLTNHQQKKSETNQNEINVNDVSIYKSIYNDSNKDYAKFINKYQFVKSDGGNITQVSNPTEYYENNILNKSGNLENVLKKSNDLAINNSKSNINNPSNLKNILKNTNSINIIGINNSINNIFTINNNNNNNNNISNNSNIVNIYTKPSTLITSYVVYSLFNIYTKQNKDSLKNSVFTTIGNIFKNKI